MPKNKLNFSGKKSVLFSAVILGKKEEKKTLEKKAEEMKEVFLKENLKVKRSGGRSQAFDPHLLVSERKYYSTGAVAEIKKTARELESEMEKWKKSFEKICKKFKVEFGQIRVPGVMSEFIFPGKKLVRFELMFYLARDKKRKKAQEEKISKLLELLKKRKFQVGPILKNTYIWTVFFAKKSTMSELTKLREEREKLGNEFGAKKFGGKFSQPEFEILKDEDYLKKIR